MSVLITGASGFVGSALCAHLTARGQVVTGAVRSIPEKKMTGVDYRIVAALNADTDWQEVFTGVDKIVHCAARVHVMHETGAEALEAYREVNVKGTIRLAEQASDNGIGRFVYLSSIKVNGENTTSHPFNPEDLPAPEDPYSISKWEAEQALKRISAKTGLEVVIIRPPLVYGPGVGANFLRLMQVLNLRIPLPFGAIHNSRSLVALDNLIDLIAICLNHPKAADQIFLVSDGDDLSTTTLLLRIANALGKPAHLIPVKASLLWAVARLLGKVDLTHRLCGSLQIDIGKTRDLLGWSPSISSDEALKKTAKHFLKK